MEFFVTLAGFSLLALYVLCCIFSIWDIREKEKREKKENDEKMRRRYIREHRGIFGVSEKGATEMGSEQEIFVVSPKKMGIVEGTGRRWS